MRKTVFIRSITLSINMGTVNSSKFVQHSVVYYFIILNLENVPTLELTFACNLIAPIKPKQASKNLSTTCIKDHICTFCIPCTCKFVRL